MNDFTYSPPSEPLRMVHIDRQLLIVEKPAGLLSVPGKGDGMADCLIARLREDFPEVLLVHRLDLDTSGVMVFAQTAKAQRQLGLQFEKRGVAKRYVARVWGVPAEPSGRVDLPLCVDWPNRPRQHVDHAEGRPAQTDWTVVAAEGTTARLHLHPLTGRSHQLRVHMKEIGHPILGDRLYAEGAARDFPRLMLHAEMIGFRHPDGGRPVEFTAPCRF